MMIARVLALLALLLIADASAAEERFLRRDIELDGIARPYQLYLPPGYDTQQRWPLILFLHGGGQEGDDGEAPLGIGLPAQLRAHPQDWPAIVVIPQVRRDQRWNGFEARVAMAALAEVERDYAYDPARVYLTGLSRGGAGSWYLGYRHPEHFAALLAICGRITAGTMLNGHVSHDEDPTVPWGQGDVFAALARRLRHLPIRVAHGADDDVIPVQQSRGIVAALGEVGNPVGYTEFAGRGHDVWDDVYADPELRRWLFAQRRADPR